MAYVCTQLNEQNQCTAWAEQGFLGLPAITSDQAGQISSAIALVLILAWGYKTLARLIRSIT